MTNDLFVELFAGLHGWGEGALAEGFRVIGFDIFNMCKELGQEKPHVIELVLQDVLTIHGSQLKNAAVIVASPPCTEYSYMAMPWKRAKQIAHALRTGSDNFPAGYTGSRTIAELNALFDACFRIQREASEAAGRYIPLIVENVKGAQPWVGRARWHFGSYYLWGDVPALMPIPSRRAKISGQDWSRFAKIGEVSPHWRMQGLKTVEHLNIRDDGTKFSQSGNEWFDGTPRDKMLGNVGPAAFGSNSAKRKAASAQIAKIPFPLARHIASCFRTVNPETTLQSVAS